MYNVLLYTRGGDDPAPADPAEQLEPPIQRPEALDADTRRTGLRAEHLAVKRYPGPAGLILRDAIRAYLEFGYRVDLRSPVPALINELTA